MTPTKAGEGKTTTLVGLTQGLGVIGKNPVACLREAVARAGVRDQGRRGRRRPDPGRPDGGPQPPLHRRHPRDRRRQQPAGGDDRRLDPARQPAQHRRAADRLAARRRHERPGAAPDRDRPRRPRQRLPARDRLRHHRRLRGHGDHGRLPRPAGPAPAARARSPRRTRSTAASRSPPRICGAAGAMAVLLKDALKPNLVQTLEGQPVPDALRPVRQHRPRQQLADRRPDRDEARRLRRDRVGLRLRHGDGEVLRHRLPRSAS